MTPQTPAQGILMHNNWGDSIQYTVTCQCGCDEHAHHLWVEAGDADITVSILTQLKSNWWSKTRWRHIWNLLTKGYVELEGSTILNRQQALNYAETLKSAIDDVNKFRKSR